MQRENGQELAPVGPKQRVCTMTGMEYESGEGAPERAFSGVFLFCDNYCFIATFFTLVRFDVLATISGSGHCAISG